MANSCAWLLCLFSVLLGHGFVLQLEASHHVYRHLESDQSTTANQPYRTAYHFQPPKNWMNDPNGPMIHKGLYHLFYQYNPYGAVWGHIVWAHSTSTDLINWTPHDPAIYPTQESDINGCWSGSATILPRSKPAILYTGINRQNQQVQNLAVPKNLSDPYLIEWVKSPNNALMAPTAMNKINSSSFRDPTTAWQGPDGRWRVIIGSKRDDRGMAILYRSKDFVHWLEAKHPLHSANGSGMWECPDFYPVSVGIQNGVETSMVGLGIKHVLKWKMILVGDMIMGSFMLQRLSLIVLRPGGSLWGWINESTNATIDIMKGWAGIQGIPKSLWLDKSGKQLVQWPVVEIEKLRVNQVDSPSKVLNGGSVLEVSGITATQADVDIAFEINEFDKVDVLDPSWTNPQLLCSQKGASVKGELGPFGLLVLASNGLQEYTAVFFRIFKGQDKYVVLMCSDQSRSSLHLDYDKTTYGAFVDVDPLQEKLSLRSLVS
ncbi:hypothetical protein F0562_022832 [Nyssa sinensis]|uniref:Glycosyl hydrolase family 32 N-terminal domain-containing protein n=1 Tax=Nyssa sinensis TaxID=561372 RepID=A0A5J5BHD6_9ASTE|nr:hypothetical protein F0562_022832 [Nyssa sinensis]